MSCVRECFIYPSFNYLRAQMSLSHFVFGQISDSFFIINLAVIFGIGKMCLSVFLSVILFHRCDASRSTSSATNIEWLNTSAILFSLTIVSLRSTSFCLRWSMSMSCCFKPSIIIFIKQNGRSWKFCLRLSCIVVCNSHILNATLNIVAILIGHYPLSSIDYIWIHSISIWFLWNSMNISKLIALYRTWVLIV